MAVRRVIEEVDVGVDDGPASVARSRGLVIALPISLVRSAVGFRRERC